MSKYFAYNLEIQFFKLYKNMFKNIIKSIPNVYFKDSVLSDQREIETIIDRELAELEPKIKTWSAALVAFSQKTFNQKILSVLPLKYKRRFNLETIKLILKRPILTETLDKFYYSIKLYNEQIKQELLQRTLPITMKAVEQGASMKTVAKELETLYGWSESKASLHASTSTANILSSVDRQHFVANKLEWYIWSASNDERVRASHSSLNDTRRKLGEDIEPGQEFRCRCTKLPDEQEVLKAIFPNE